MKNCLKVISVILISMLFLTGCGKDLTKGDIENYHYEETEEVTNYVKIVTNKDKVILIELYPDEAPLTVANFQKLVSEKFYDNIIFHRVVAGFMVQTGGPDGTGFGGSSEKITGEFANNNITNNIKHEEGIVSMARSNDMNSASSQFFICVNSNDYLSYLDGNYAAFGKVIAGYDYVVEISNAPTDDNDKPLSKEYMKTVRFVNIKEN